MFARKGVGCFLFLYPKGVFSIFWKGVLPVKEYLTVLELGPQKEFGLFWK